MHEGPHLSSDFQSGVTRRQLLVQSKRKNLQEMVLLKGDNTDWLILGFDPQYEIIWFNRTIIFLSVGCVNIASPAPGGDFASRVFSEKKGFVGLLSLSGHKIKLALGRSYFVFALLVGLISSGSVGSDTPM